MFTTGQAHYGQLILVLFSSVRLATKTGSNRHNSFDKLWMQGTVCLFVSVNLTHNLSPNTVSILSNSLELCSSWIFPCPGLLAYAYFIPERLKSTMM